MTNPLQERRLREELINKRLKALLKNPGNRFCAECTEPKPTWAVLLEPPIEGSNKLGLLCCYNCYSYHFRLGREVCVVKSATMASDWSEAEVQVLEKSGNTMVNAIYEVFLEDAAEKNDMKVFVENKYQHRQYFGEQAYLEQVAQLCIARKTRSQLQRSSSNRSLCDQQGSDDAVPSLLTKKRPSLHRSRSKRLSSTPNSMDRKERGLQRTKSNDECGLHSQRKPGLLEAKTDRVRRSLLRTKSNDDGGFRTKNRLLFEAKSDHVRRSSRKFGAIDSKQTGLDRASDHVRQPARKRSHSKDKLPAMSEYVMMSRPCHRGESHDDLLASKPDGRRHPHSAGRTIELDKAPTGLSSSAPRVPRRSCRSDDGGRHKALTLDSRPKLTRSHSERHAVRRLCSCRESSVDSDKLDSRGQQYMPHVPDSLEVPTTIEVPMICWEQDDDDDDDDDLASFSEDLDTSSEHGQLSYQLPRYLEASCSSSDRLNNGSGDHTQGELDTSLAAYEKRYENAVRSSLSGAIVESIISPPRPDSAAALLDCPWPMCPSSSNQFRPSSVPDEMKSVDAAFWKTTFAALADVDSTHVDGKLTKYPASREGHHQMTLADTSLPDQPSTRVRTA